MISFTVRGLPAPQGSKRAFVNRHTGRAALVESSSKVKPWRSDIRDQAEKAMSSEPDSSLFGGFAVAPPLTGPLQVGLTFRLPRPKGHYGSGRNAAQLKASAPRWPTSKPDIDKLTRAVLDALTSIVWTDDAQVAAMIVSKRYADEKQGPPGVTVEVYELDEDIPRETRGAA